MKEREVEEMSRDVYRQDCVTMVDDAYLITRGLWVASSDQLKSTPSIAKMAEAHCRCKPADISKSKNPTGMQL